MRRTDELGRHPARLRALTTTGARHGSGDVDSESDWWGIVIDEFGLALWRSTGRRARARLVMVRSAHEAWDAAGRS